MATNANPQIGRVFQELADSLGCSVFSEQFASALDARDPLKRLRAEFHIPKVKDLPHTDSSMIPHRLNEDSVYMRSNSVGLQPKGIRKTLDRELDKWAKMGVYGNRYGEMPWGLCGDIMKEESAKIVGAKSDEVAIMNGLTVNLHLLLISFYRPTPQRYKILLESGAFSSDHIQLHGYDPATSMLCLKPKEGEETLRTEDILDLIEKEGDAVAVILLPGVQFYTGQLFQMEAITKKGHEKGCYVGFDLAHAVGNAEIQLHDWAVDFACWCTYKYLSSGAGGIGGAFIHEKHERNTLPKLSGWWGHKIQTRLEMTNCMDRSPGVAGYRLSNSSSLLCASLEASLNVFAMTTMADLRSKSMHLTGYLEYLLLSEFPAENEKGDPGVWIITPTDPEQRAAQLSIKLSVPIKEVVTELEKRGVAVMLSKGVMRVALAPVYNSFTDVYRFAKFLGESMEAVRIHLERN